MATQFELFRKLKTEKKKIKQRPKFEAVIDGFGIETIDQTAEDHVCFACNLLIKPGSKAEKSTPVVDERPQWQYTKYRHLPSCPPPEDEP